jgi:hypothetical protein
MTTVVRRSVTVAVDALGASTRELAEHQIARRAYLLFEQDGGRHGHDWYWLQAERE